MSLPLKINSFDEIRNFLNETIAEYSDTPYFSQIERMYQKALESSKLNEMVLILKATIHQQAKDLNLEESNFNNLPEDLTLADFLQSPKYETLASINLNFIYFISLYAMSSDNREHISEENIEEIGQLLTDPICTLFTEPENILNFFQTQLSPKIFDSKTSTSKKLDILNFLYLNIFNQEKLESFYSEENQKRTIAIFCTYLAYIIQDFDKIFIQTTESSGNYNELSVALDLEENQNLSLSQIFSSLYPNNITYSQFQSECINIIFSLFSPFMHIENTDSLGNIANSKSQKFFLATPIENQQYYADEFIRVLNESFSLDLKIPNEVIKFSLSNFQYHEDIKSIIIQPVIDLQGTTFVNSNFTLFLYGFIEKFKQFYNTKFVAKKTSLQPLNIVFNTPYLESSRNELTLKRHTSAVIIHLTSDPDVNLVFKKLFKSLFFSELIKNMPLINYTYKEQNQMLLDLHLDTHQFISKFDMELIKALQVKNNFKFKRSKKMQFNHLKYAVLPLRNSKRYKD